MIELPELTEASTRSEVIEWLAAAEKKNNDLWEKAIARDKLKKAKRKLSAPRAHG
jgi:predicted Fe-S protein YdhL (DUF1289 family)